MNDTMTNIDDDDVADDDDDVADDISDSGNGNNVESSGNGMSESEKIAQLGAEIQSRIMSEQTVIAFLASIVASISVPNLISPGDLANHEYWNAYYVQWIYGFFWCLTATTALLSVMLSISIILAFNNTSPQQTISGSD